MPSCLLRPSSACPPPFGPKAGLGPCATGPSCASTPRPDARCVTRAVLKDPCGTASTTWTTAPWSLSAMGLRCQPGRCWRPGMRAQPHGPLRRRRSATAWSSASAVPRMPAGNPGPVSRPASCCRKLSPPPPTQHQAPPLGRPRRPAPRPCPTPHFRSAPRLPAGPQSATAPGWWSASAVPMGAAPKPPRAIRPANCSAWSPRSGPPEAIRGP